MGGQDQTGTNLGSQAKEPGVSRLAGAGFAGVGTQLEAGHVRGETKTRGNRPHRLGHRGAIGMDPVIGMSDQECQPRCGSGSGQEVEQRTGIGAARHRDERHSPG